VNNKNLTSGLSDRTILWLIISSSILLTIVIQVLLYLKGFYSISADESGRTLFAYYWLKGVEPLGEPWLPFHKIIIAAALKIDFNLFWTPRIVVSFFAVLSTIFIIWYSNELFKNRRVIILAALLTIFFPPLVIIRTVPLAEIMFILLIVSGSIFFIKWLHSGKNIYLFFTALFFALSSSARYEGWIFSFCFFIYILYNRKKISWKIITLLLIILSAFPIYWISFNAIELGNPLGFISSTSGGYSLHHNTLIDLAKYNLIAQFIVQNIIYLNFLGLISLFFLSFIDKKIRNWILIPLLAFVIMAFLSLVKIGLPSHAFWRIPLIWSVLLIPFTAHFIIKLSEFFADIYQKRKIAFAIWITSIIIVYFSFQIWRLSNSSDFTEDDLRAGRYLKEKIIESGSVFKILIDSSEWIYMNIYISSENPEAFITNSGDISSEPEEPLISPGKGLDISFIKKNDIRYLLFKRNDYKDFLDGRKELEEIKNFGDWKLYKVSFLN